MIVCPGCGGRNNPTAQACEWCARPFVAQHRERSALWIWAAIGSAVLVLALIAVGALLLSERSIASGTRIHSTEVPAEATDTAGEVPQAPDATDSAEVPPGVTTPEFVRIGNTGGTGAFIRSEPRTDAPGIVAKRDGTVLEVVGPDIVTAGRTWKHVQDQQGNDGWTPGEFVLPSETGF